VGAALVVDNAAGRLVCHRGHASYDRAVCDRLGSALGKAVDIIQLQQEDWESVSARYGEGKVLLLHNLGAAGGGTHVLAVVADAPVNLSFATVAIRVAANKLKRALGGGAAAFVQADTPPLAASSSSLAASSPPASSRLEDSSPALAGSSSLSGPQTSGVLLSRIAVADPASATFLSRSARELARHLGPKAEVCVEEAVRRVSPDTPFSLTRGAKLLDDLAGQIEDNGDRMRFRRALEKGWTGAVAARPSHDGRGGRVGRCREGKIAGAEIAECPLSTRCEAS
jgi:hypothetical protein